MIQWFGRRGPASRGAGEAAQRRRPVRRGARIDRVAIEQLRPAPRPFLGQAAYLQLTLFDAIGAASADAPDLLAKEQLAEVGRLVLEKHRVLHQALLDDDAEPALEMTPYVAEIDRYRRRLADADWTERVLAIHLTGGLLDDFFSRLAGGLPESLADRIQPALADAREHEVLIALLQRRIERDARTAARLGLWGRRIVGDTLLAARAAAASATKVGAPAEDEAIIEPVMTELVAAHTRRMDTLGLTA